MIAAFRTANGRIACAVARAIEFAGIVHLNHNRNRVAGFLNSPARFRFFFSAIQERAEMVEHREISDNWSC